eukprot:1795450-Amphidinium_carterae.1
MEINLRTDKFNNRDHLLYKTCLRQLVMSCARYGSCMCKRFFRMQVLPKGISLISLFSSLSSSAMAPEAKPRGCYPMALWHINLLWMPAFELT